MDWATIIALLVFLIVVTLIVGLWWISATSRRIRDRLAHRGRGVVETNTKLLRARFSEADSGWAVLISRFPLLGHLTALPEQAGYEPARVTDFLLLIGLFALAGGAAAAFRMGGIVWGVLAAPIAGSVPVFYLLYKRYRRVKEFEAQFPDALDMMTRAIRAGYALSGAVQEVGEQMPDPVGQEFRRVSEEIRLGLDPGEALSRLQRRVSTEDTTFFCTTIAIQRSTGGNLAEILDRLSEVIRARFKLLNHARVLSSQARGTAVVVGVSPLAFAFLFEFISPGFFDPLLNSPHAPYLIGIGLIFEAIGFFLIYRIANIKV